MSLSLPHDDVTPTEDEIAELGLPQAMIVAFQRAQANYEKLRMQWPLGSGADIAKVPHARVYNSANIAVADVTQTALTFNSERWDLGVSSEQHSTSVNPSRLTCQRAGLYAIGGATAYDINGTGERFTSIRLNGSTYLDQAECKASTTGGYGTQVNVQTQCRLAIADYVELVAFQNSGGALNVLALGNYSPEFYWHWLSP